MRPFLSIASTHRIQLLHIIVLCTFLNTLHHVSGFTPPRYMKHTNHNKPTIHKQAFETHLLPPPLFISATLKKAEVDGNNNNVFNTEMSNAYTLAPPPNDDILLNIKPGQRIVSFGDVHGDLNALQKFLTIAEVLHVNSTMEDPIWSGGSTICVQCGDILDRGGQELACIRTLSKLSQQALEHGGSIICLLGNHEIKNCLGSFEYATMEGNFEFESTFGPYLDNTSKSSKWRVQYANNQPCRWNVCEPGIGMLSLCTFSNMKVAVAIGRTVFVHAGLTKEHLLHCGGGIPGLNDKAHDWISKVHHNELNDNGEYETVDHLLASVQNRMNSAMSNIPQSISGNIGSLSPIWMRDYSKPANKPPTNPSAQRMIDEALTEIGNGAQRIVMGHTPQAHINAALKGKAWRIDVGASKGVANGIPEVLEIIHGASAEEDVLHILNCRGGKSFTRIPGSDRMVSDVDILF